MIIIQDVLISDDVVQEEFVCNLSACKGACCWQGDFGAPVSSDEEKEILHNLVPIREYLSQESNQLLDEKGCFQTYSDTNFTGTTLHENGACVFMTFDENGCAKCGIEKAYELGASTFKKPISCHLYPIRVVKNEESNFEAWNYDVWDICSEACILGKKESVPIYKFLENAITRYKGEDFFEELDLAVKHINR